MAFGIRSTNAIGAAVLQARIHRFTANRSV
jgi:hypothetical protein